MRDNSKISVIVTSALCVNKTGELLGHPENLRLERLLKTLSFLYSFNFGKIIILDSTLPINYSDLSDQFSAYHAKIFRPERKLKAIDKEYEVFGPSRLEIDLLHSSEVYLREELQSSEYVLKITAGYVIKNLYKILEQARYGIVYRFGNPTRIKIRFCMTCFYLLPRTKFFEFDKFCFENLSNVARSKPLEAHLYEFIKKIEAKPVSIFYPILEATFLSSNQSSADFNYQAKQFIYTGLSALGLYAFEIR